MSHMDSIAKAHADVLTPKPLAADTMVAPETNTSSCCPWTGDRSPNQSLLASLGNLGRPRTNRINKYGKKNNIEKS